MCNERRRAIRCCCLLPLLLHVLLPIAACAAAGVADDAREEAARAEFCSEYQAYRDAPAPGRYSSASFSPEAGLHLARISELGPRVLPYVIDEARNSQDMGLNVPLGRLARVSFIPAGWPGAEGLDSRRCVELFIEWWDAGQKRADEMFAEAYAEDDVVRIGALGWGVMPRIVEKLREGDADLMPAVKQITLVELRVKRIPASAIESPEAWVAWWEENKEDWAIPFPDLKKKAEEKAKGEATPDAKPEGDAQPEDTPKPPDPAPKED